MKIGITQKTPLGDQADSLIPITAIIDITEEKTRNVIAERAVDQKIPSRDSKRCFAFNSMAADLFVLLELTRHFTSVISFSAFTPNPF
jgi:hypothetical protein